MATTSSDPKADPDALGEQFSAAVARLSTAGAQLVVFAGFDPRIRLPLGQRLAVRASAYNAHIRAAAAEHGALLVDLWVMDFLRDPRMWGADRLHLSSEGHRRVAAAVLEALGLEPGFDWGAALPAAVHRPGRRPAWRTSGGPRTTSPPGSVGIFEAARPATRSSPNDHTRPVGSNRRTCTT